MKHSIQIVTAVLLVIMSTTASAEPDTWTESIPAQEIREDFAALYNGLKNAHADLYAQRSKRDYDRRYDKMLASFNQPMTRFDVHLAFARFTAYGNVAHARIDFPESAYERFQDSGGRTFPIYPRIVEGIAYVGHNYSGDTRIRAGDHLVALNGTSMTQWLERTSALMSADTPYIAHSLLEFKFPQYLWAIAGEMHAFDVVLRRQDQLIELTIPALDRDARLAASEQRPAAFELDSTSRTFRMINSKVAYLRPGPFYNV